MSQVVDVEAMILNLKGLLSYDLKALYIVQTQN